MTWVSRRPARAVAGRGLAVLLVLAGLAAACGGPGASPGPAATASLGPASSGRPDAVASPADGFLVKIEAEGLTKVTGFRLRTDDGSEVAFRIGVLENGVEFPPGHLAEHMATTSKVRVFFREEGGERVVYRLEDAE